MNNLLSNIKIEVPSGTYLKDPESSTLGKKILTHSIILIDEMGFESFNFKKLGAAIQSNESSIYRYFESKHKLLVYLTSWYWGWLEYQLVIETYSLTSIEDKLKKAIKVLTRTTKNDNTYTHINEVLLNTIVINENSKSYLTKDVDDDNKEGFFMPYKRVVKRFSELISEYQPDYDYPLSLASTVIQSALHQQFVKDHFKTISNFNKQHTPTQFFTDLVLNALTYGK
ncbi:TetR/AcrR family transcriptional regulator [Meridianimaribacter sp. CL38]|uniref:TetR/AcrR family transcriptional regulator n=1 Tax=Meridianimaribacter sp. CL38 TaxID=2213021 RepID=UPI00103A24B3|nr:TetR/AcrR family transcriptional regulator [Meridianimaribacter sp. CL38]TBV26631.1 TetR/AcrR family transcriptional regulator [Meridianimaribacter sp. CL38]